MKRGFALVVAAALQAPDAGHAFCVVNAIPDRTVHARLLPAGPPVAKLYEDAIAPGRESCCNPRNVDCNPARAADASMLRFNARVEAAPPSARMPRTRQPPDLACGAAPDRFDEPVVFAPVRGYLRFEPNAAFDRRRPVGYGNPQFVVTTLRADRVVVHASPCIERP